MFDIISLVITWGLWKLVAIAGLLIFVFAIFLVGILMIGIGEINSEKSALALILIALIVSIPYWNWIDRHDATDGLTDQIMQPFSTYRAEVEKDRNYKPPTKTIISTELHRYRLIDWNPPKHFYVTLRNVKTNKVTDSIHVSKHCNMHVSLKAGTEYNIKVNKYVMSDKPQIVFTEFGESLYPIFCSE